MSERELQHERMRFNGMSLAQLNTRLTRITKSNKLLNFAYIAEEYGYYTLAADARNKFEELYSHSVGQGERTPQEVSGNGYARGSLGTQATSTTRSRNVARKAKVEVVEDPEKKKRAGKRVIRI